MQQLILGAACVTSLLAGGVTAQEIRGWQQMRVIEQPGRPSVLRAADIDGDGRAELIVVNRRSSRIDTYHWLSAGERQEPRQPAADQPNELPMADDFRRDELQLEYLPRDVLSANLDEAVGAELVVLVGPPNRVLVYGHDADGKLDLRQRFDLTDGAIASRHKAMLLRPRPGAPPELLVSMDEGIQKLRLEPNGRWQWLTPREDRDRVDWWLSDLDGDGLTDIVEQTRESDESVRWYRCAENGEFMPAQPLFDRGVNGVEVFQHEGNSQLLLLDGSVKYLLRRYGLVSGESHRLGRRWPLAWEAGRTPVWCGLERGSDRAVVMTDADRPRLLCYALTDEGWGTEQAFPAVGNIKSLAAPAAQPGALLLWTADAADLQITRWDGKRLSYPQTWPPADAAAERRILALESVGTTTWWVQKVGTDLHLYRWVSGQEEPVLTRFEGVGKLAEQVRWIGGERLLCKDKHARDLKLIVNQGGQAVVSQPSHLKKAALDEFLLIPVVETLRLARLTDGVLQWMDDALQPLDQIMLPQGQELANYVSADEKSGWALQRDAPFIHRLEFDQAGIAQVVDSVKVSAADELVRDAVLGLILVGKNRLTHLSEGQPYELDLVDLVDNRIGLSGGVRETRFHRIRTADVDGDGSEEVLLIDDLKHRVGILSGEDGGLALQISWPVFDDKKYPYGDEAQELVHEPRAIVAADVDGDGQQDLAMLCHDRLIVYLARQADEEPVETGKKPASS